MKFKDLYAIRNGIFFKTLFGLIAILIPFFIVNSLINRSGVDIIRQKITTVMQQKIDYLVSSMDAELKRIVQLQMQFNDDSDLKDLSIRSSSLREYEKIKLINDLHSKLSSLASSSRYINEVFVLMPNFHKRLSSETMLTNLDKNEYENFRQIAVNQSNVKTIDDRYYLVSGYPVGTKTQFILVIELSTSNIGKSLSDMSFIVDNSRDYQFPVNDSLHMGLKELEGNRDYITLTQRFTFTDWSLVVYDREDNLLRPIRSIAKWNYILWVLALMVLLFLSYLILQLIHRPLRKLVKAFRMVEIGNFSLNLQHHNKDEFEYLFSKFNQMVSKLKVLVQEVYEQTIHRQQAELRQLQSQINPHFLYNSLYLLYRMSQDKDFTGVSYLSRHLGDYFKYITQHNMDDFITLNKEINHARSYLLIQQMRFGNRISFVWEVPEEADDIGSILQRNVPRLCIQPLIENAIVHGHEDTVKEGWIRLALSDHGDFIEIVVEDNGKGMKAEHIADLQEKMNAGYEEKGHALFNVHRRLQLLFGAGSGLRLTENPHGGLSILITIFWEGDRHHV